MNRLAAVLCAALMAAACRGDQPRATTPTAPSITTSPASQTLFGSVSDTAFGPLVGARVEIVDGPQAGTFLTTTQDGRFSIAFRSSETVTVRATKGGYVPATMSVRPPSGIFLSFYLSSVAAPVNMAGTYTLTFVADSTCTQIPDALRTRTYTGTITPSPYRSDNTLFAVRLSDASFFQAVYARPTGAYNSFSVGVAGDFVAFSVFNDYDEGEGIVEQLGPAAYLTIAGSAGASVGAPNASAISAPFDGRFQYCVFNVAPGGDGYRCDAPSALAEFAECRSKNHRLILTRR